MKRHKKKKPDYEERQVQLQTRVSTTKVDLRVRWKADIGAAEKKLKQLHAERRVQRKFGKAHPDDDPKTDNGQLLSFRLLYIADEIKLVSAELRGAKTRLSEL